VLPVHVLRHACGLISTPGVLVGALPELIHYGGAGCLGTANVDELIPADNRDAISRRVSRR
jgi:hypothetical protein